jgi:hypothetical protein
VRSHGSCEPLLATWQCLTLMVISHASLAAGGKSKACLHYVPLRLWLILCSLSKITASLADVQRTLASLTNAVANAVPRQSLEDDRDPTQREQQGHRHGSLSVSDPTTVPVAPIQVVRNMHSWITGQRPDGKSETTPHGNPSMVSLEASSEGAYIRS